MIYPARYLAEPRKRNAYTDACDAISIYGITRNQWNYKRFDICRTEMKEIWSIALSDMEGKSKYDIVFSLKKREWGMC